MLLIFDEAQTAFGRVGASCSASKLGVTPDIMTLSKTLGGGRPLSATITSPDIEDRAHTAGFSFYTSHVSDPLPASVGLAVLQTIQQEDLVARAIRMGNYLTERLRDLQQQHESIGDIRGEGLLLGVELVTDRETRQPFHQLGAVTTERCLSLIHI